MKFIYKISSILLILVFITAGNGYSLPASKTTLRVQLQSSTEDGANRQKELVRRIGSIRDGGKLGKALQDTINPSRGADKGYINIWEHRHVRKWLSWDKARNKKNRREDLEEELGVKGEIEIYIVSGMYNAFTETKGHYAIRDGVVYVDENTFNILGRIYLEHEIFELREILLFAERRWNSNGRLSKKEVRDRLVKWLDEHGDVSEITKVLVDIHNRAPILPKDDDKTELVSGGDFSEKMKVAEILRNALEICLRHEGPPLVLTGSDRQIWTSIFQEARLRTGSMPEFDTYADKVAALYSQLLREARNEDEKLKEFERFSIGEFKIILGILDTRITRPVRGAANEKSSYPIVKKLLTLPALIGDIGTVDLDSVFVVPERNITSTGV